MTSDASPGYVLYFALGILVLALLVAVIVGIGTWVDSAHKHNPGFESRQLHFAAVTLTGIGLIFVLSMAMYYYGGKDSHGKDVFDACSTILPPIITLVLGFYFGRTTQERPGPSLTAGPQHSPSSGQTVQANNGSSEAVTP